MQAVNSHYETLLQRYATLLNNAEVGLAALDDGMSADSVDRLVDLVDCSEVCRHSMLSALYLHFSPHPLGPLSSDRQHQSYDVCLEVREEITRTVLFCSVY